MNAFESIADVPSFAWIDRFGARLHVALPDLPAVAVTRYAMAAVRGLGHEVPEAAADRIAAGLPHG